MPEDYQVLKEIELAERKNKMKFSYFCEDAFFLVKVGVEVRGRLVEYHDVNIIHLMGHVILKLGL